MFDKVIKRGNCPIAHHPVLNYDVIQHPTTPMKHELYRAEVNGQPVLRVSAEVPAWAPHPSINPPWLRWMLAMAIRRYFCRPV